MTDVLARRVAAHGLARRSSMTLEQAAGICGLQDSYPGAPEVALAARLPEFRAEDLERALEERRLVKLFSVRGAQLIVPAADLEVFSLGLLPVGEKRLRAFMPGAVRRLEKNGADFMEAFGATRREALAALADGPLSYQALHDALKERLPLEMRPWCEPCGSHHAVFSLVRATGLEGRIVLAGRSDLALTEHWLGRSVQSGDPKAASVELARRFLHAFGPSTPELLASWAGVTKDQAREAWAGLDVKPVGEAFVLRSDPVGMPPAAEGLRLLPPGDPLLGMPDRDVLAPREVTKRLFRPVGSPGAVLLEGRLAGLWRPRKDRRKLKLAVEPLEPLPPDLLEEEAHRVAAARGCEEVLVTP